MANEIYRKRCAAICRVDVKTWDKWVANKYIRPDGKDPRGHKYFALEKVRKFAKGLRKDRERGFPVFIGKRS